MQGASVLQYKGFGLPTSRSSQVLLCWKGSSTTALSGVPNDNRVAVSGLRLRLRPRSRFTA